MLELLSPAGNMEKLKVAFKFGADACYLAGKKFGLRAFSGNFDEKELNSLSESIKKYGVIQPIVLRKIGEKYEIIAGADNKDFFRVAEKYFPEEAALRLYSADSKK